MYAALNTGIIGAIREKKTAICGRTMVSRQSVNIGEGSEETGVKADGTAGILAKLLVSPESVGIPPTDPTPAQTGTRNPPSTIPDPAMFEKGSTSVSLNGEDGLEDITWARSSSHRESSHGIALSKSNGAVAIMSDEACDTRSLREVASVEVSGCEGEASA